MKGLDKAGYLADASSLCGACVEVCPVKIPITEILLRLRHQKEEEKKNFNSKPKAWKVRSDQSDLERMENGFLIRKYTG